MSKVWTCQSWCYWSLHSVPCRWTLCLFSSWCWCSWVWVIGSTQVVWNFGVFVHMCILRNFAAKQVILWVHNIVADFSHSCISPVPKFVACVSPSALTACLPLYCVCICHAWHTKYVVIPIWSLLPVILYVFCKQILKCWKEECMVLCLRCNKTRHTVVCWGFCTVPFLKQQHSQAIHYFDSQKHVF